MELEISLRNQQQKSLAKNTLNSLDWCNLPATRIEDVLSKDNQSPELGYLSRLPDEQRVIALDGVTELTGMQYAIITIEKHLKDFLSFCNLSESLSQDQQNMLTKLIVEEYRHLTTKDIELFFRMCMMGKFGRIYGRLDGVTIMTWLEKFDNELANKQYEMMIQEHEANKSTREGEKLLGGIPCPEDIQAALNEKIMGVRLSDNELRERESIDAIRKRIIREYMPKYRNASNEDIARLDTEVRQSIQDALAANGIFEVVTI